MGDTESMFNQLIGYLKIQEEIIGRFITTGEEQLEALRNNNLEELDKTVCDQRSHGIKMEKIEQRRLLLQASLEKVLCLEKGATLSMLIPFAPDSLQSCLKDLLSNLNKKIGELKEINSLNSSLIKNTLLLNDKLINIFNPDKSITYDPNGGIESRTKKVSVLNRSI